MQAATMYWPGTSSQRSLFDSRAKSALYHQPHNSSPLASSPASSPKSSPTGNAQARRRAQYKNVSLSSPSFEQRLRASLRKPSQSAPEKSTLPTEEAPRKAFLRERLRARFLQRTQRDRERKVERKRRYDSEPSSDGLDDTMDEDGDEDEDDEAVINDELFARIMASMNRSQRHDYRFSYACDVGSSFDPDMEDPVEWENQLKNSFSSKASDEEVPSEFNEQELAAYADEYDEYFDNNYIDDLFSFSDLDDAVDVQLATADKGKGKEIAVYSDDDWDMQA